MNLRRRACLILSLVMLISCFNVCCVQADRNDISYRVEGGNIYFDKTEKKIRGSDKAITEAEIPVTINGILVESIGSSAFYHRTELTSVIIPNSITSIGESAFGDCKALESVKIARSVASIGERAFNNCDKDLLVFHVKKDSYADTWAQEHGFKISYDDAAEEPAETAAQETGGSILTEDVSLTIGKKTITIGEKTYDIAAAPYIQESSNSTLVPLKFISLAIADGDIDYVNDSDSVDWDPVTKSATVKAGGKIVKFTAGSDLMFIGKSPSVMDNGVKAEIKDGVMFVPFKALANALSIKTEWNAQTKEAKYLAD